jgi:predicted Zn finger-like uncharacterized protein
MIIQCEKCRTRFKLDDSRVTESGVRVRCSRCGHTFIVKRESPEEESEFDALLEGFGGPERTEASRQSDVHGDVDSFDVRPSEAAPSSSATEENEGLSDGERYSAPADTVESKQDVDSSVQAFRGFFREGVALPQFQVHPATPASGDVTDREFDASLDEAFRPNDAAPSGEPVMEVDMAGEAPPEQEKHEPAMDFPGKSEEVPIAVKNEGKWPVADSRADETADDELPPLSISSRRKKSAIFPVLLGVVCLLAVIGGGLYLFQNRAGDLGSFIPKGVTKSGVHAKIQSLEGSFLVNKEAGELLVIRGQVFNSSDKPLTALRVQGTVYRSDGSVVARRTVYCGNTFTQKDLTFRSYSGIEKTMDRQFGDTLANLEIPPGKSIPFAIVFKNVPKEGKDFGAEIVNPSGVK